MCKIIEEYVIEILISACVDFGKTLDETISYVLSKYPSAKEEEVIDLYKSVSNF